MRILLCLLLLMTMPLSAAEPYPEADVRMDLQQLGEYTYYVMGLPGIATDNAGFISNAGFIVTPKGVVVIDGLGTPSLAWKLRGLIRSVTDQPVTQVIVTHYHADHIYGLQVYQDEGAEIIAPAGVYDYLNAPNAQSRLAERRVSLDPWVNEQTRLVTPDRVIEQDQLLTFGPIKLQLHYLGAAHSDGDLSVLVEPDGVLFTGDIIFEGRLPFVGDANSKRWLESLDALAQRDPKGLIPGHGPAARNPQKALRNTRDYLALLRSSMGEAVENMSDFAEAYEAVDWSAYEKQPAFKETNRRNAYQVFLALEQEMLNQP
jgi:glyoxylase-like metal-dependent hydrolase (beta-lactamase superfamily II)